MSRLGRQCWSLTTRALCSNLPGQVAANTQLSFLNCIVSPLACISPCFGLGGGHSHIAVVLLCHQFYWWARGLGCFLGVELFCFHELISSCVFASQSHEQLSLFSVARLSKPRGLCLRAAVKSRLLARTTITSDDGLPHSSYRQTVMDMGCMHAA